MPRRDDLPPLGRALSDALDDVNHRFHGLTSSWAHPDEFLESLREDGYDVVAASEMETLRAAYAEADRDANRWNQRAADAEQALREIRAVLDDHRVDVTGYQSHRREYVDGAVPADRIREVLDRYDAGQQ